MTKSLHFEIQNWILNFGTPLKFHFSPITPFFHPKFSNPYCRKSSYGPYGPFWFSAKKWFWSVKNNRESTFLEKVTFSFYQENEIIFWGKVSEKLLSVLKLPAGLLSRKNDDFWKFWTCPESKSMHFLKFGHFLKNGSPGQTTMLTTSAAKFWVEPRSPFSYISHHDPKTLGKPLIIVSWPECQP